MSPLIKLLDQFIPEHLHNNPPELMRSYILLGVIFTNLTTTSLFLVFLLTVIDLPKSNMLMATGMILITLMGCSLALAIYKRTKDYRLTGNTLLFTLLLIIGGGIQITGGYSESPVLQLLLMIPVCGFLLIGKTSGLTWLAMTLMMCGVLYLLDSQQIVTTQLIIFEKDRRILLVAIQGILLLAVGGVLVVYELINDSLKAKLEEERNKFEYKASYDDLTGIPNRFEFFKRLEKSIVECYRREQKLAVVYIDLDGFKPVNDLYGHHAGDKLLCEIAVRIENAVRLSDTVARIGGDEFALILPGIHAQEDIEKVMAKVQLLISAPVIVDNHELKISASLGVAIYPDNSRDIDELCKYADIAMYQAKAETGHFACFKQEMLVAGNLH